MARTPMVTRTILSTKANILTVNTATQETATKEYILPRTYKDKKDMLKTAKKLYDSEEVVLVSIIDSKVDETLYGMLENEFIEHAKVLPPRDAKEDTNENA